MYRSIESEFIQGFNQKITGKDFQVKIKKITYGGLLKVWAEVIVDNEIVSKHTLVLV